MSQVHLTVALNLDTGRPGDRALLSRMLFAVSDPRDVPVEEPPAQDQPPADPPAEEPAEEVPPPAAKTNRQKTVTKTAKPGPAGTNGEAQDHQQDQDDDEDLGLGEPSMSPGEARDQALALVREIYAAGKVAEVKALQKEYAVAKFYDVPVEKGHEFHRRVMQVAQSVGLRT